MTQQGWVLGFDTVVFSHGESGISLNPFLLPLSLEVLLCFVQVLGENEKPWKAVLVALTEKDLLIFESMPRIKEAWFTPLHSYPLLATRYVLYQTSNS